MRINSQNKSSAGYLVKNAIVAALYVTLTVTLAPFSYGAFQMRVSEVFMLLPFYNKNYSWGLILGCLIANLFSPLGLVDIVVGTTSTAIVCVAYRFIKNDWVAAIFTSVFTGLSIGGIILHLFLGMPLVMAFFATATGQLGAMLIGVVLFRFLLKNSQARKFILA